MNACRVMERGAVVRCVMLESSKIKTAGKMYHRATWFVIHIAFWPLWGIHRVGCTVASVSMLAQMKVAGTGKQMTAARIWELVGMSLFD